jgi:hypothetical protein
MAGRVGRAGTVGDANRPRRLPGGGCLGLPSDRHPSPVDQGESGDGFHPKARPGSRGSERARDSQQSFLSLLV